MDFDSARALVLTLFCKLDIIAAVLSLLSLAVWFMLQVKRFHRVIFKVVKNPL